jgi:outer membrane protein OmpA-like peptidoglycan-associated protein
MHMLGRSLSLAAAAALLLGACNQSPPPPAAAAPPPPQQPMTSGFRVLFASGSSTVQVPEQATIQQAAAAYRSRAGASIALTGHTDTTGSPAFNQALSQRRVDAVTAGLVAAGVPATSITATSATGEMNPPVRTGDQVSDQKNRSVEITVMQAPGPMMTDAQYCAMLAPKVRELSRGSDPTGDLGRALSNCQSGVGNYGIPFMTKYLSDNNVPVPPRT